MRIPTQSLSYRLSKRPANEAELPETLARRKLMLGTLWSLVAPLAACGGGSGGESSGTAPSPSPTPTPPPPPPPPVVTTPAVTGLRYRYQHPRLYQSVPGATTASRIAGGSAFTWNHLGANYRYVDMSTGWCWDNPGGDWIDANQVRQGLAPWFTINANQVAGSTAVATYSVDVTNVVRFVQVQRRWNAFILKDGMGPRTLAGRHQNSWPVPVMTVVYDDDSTATLNCLHSASLSAGSALSNSTATKLPNPTTLEFERPTKPVKSATLQLTIVEHWSGSNPVISGYLVDPPINADTMRLGVAASAGALDAQLASAPSIIGVHRYVDGSTRSEFIYPTTINFGAEREYDPAIYAGGSADLSKLPHRGLGQWINAGNNFALVNSSYSGEGFVPLAPGLGAMKVSMAAEPGLGDGSSIDFSGTLGSNAVIFLPEPDFGLLKRLFVRYYLRIGTPYDVPFSRRYQVYQTNATTPVWTDMGGKFGITPAHDTAYGGVSGTSGGGYGWQMRLSWADCDAAQGCGNENALTLGVHTYDFLYRNPAGHNYGGTDGPRDAYCGQRGGLGSVLYPGQWYCIDMEVDLNSVSPAAPGFTPDGAVRVWIDGRLTYERTSMVMRTLPLHSPTPDETRLRPIRELGHRNLWFNWFHGGKTKNSIDRTLFITGLAWGRQYIGPMAI